MFLSYHCRRDCSIDSSFQITSAISYHYGEAHVRARFTEYTARFVRLAARYEEDMLGAPMVGYPTALYTVGPNGERTLGSGIAFVDEITCMRELQINANRIEGWRRTESYKLCQEVFRTDAPPLECDPDFFRRTSRTTERLIQYKGSMWHISYGACVLRNGC